MDKRLVRAGTFLAALFAIGWGTDAHAGKRTVCTITVNSPNEKDAFKRYLPDDQYQFVELVDFGIFRDDGPALVSACQRGR